MYRNSYVELNPTECAGRGALMLDDALPGWWKGIDVKKIDLTSTDWCILAQCYPMISDKVHIKVGNIPLLQQTRFGATSDYLESHGHRFNLYLFGFGIEGYTREKHQALKQAWKFEIECRLARDKAVPIPVLHVVPEYELVA